jgi:hypothetical protein
MPDNGNVFLQGGSESSPFVGVDDMVKLGLIEEARELFGAPVARWLWVAIGLETVPAMFERDQGASPSPS